MKYRLMMLSFIMVMFLLHGCVSQIASIETYTKGWIGRPVAELKDVITRPTSYASSIGWQEKTYQLNNGNWVYVTPDRKGCFIHWEVNPDGIIIGYKTEGKRCW